MPTIAIPRLYSILLERVLPLVDAWCDSQMTNLILLMMGLYKGRSVHLTRIASKTISSHSPQHVLTTPAQPGHTPPPP